LCRDLIIRLAIGPDPKEKPRRRRTTGLTALRQPPHDPLRDPATGLAWAARIKMLEDAMTPAEYEEALANVGRVARELNRTIPANDDKPPPTGRRRETRRLSVPTGTQRERYRARHEISPHRILTVLWEASA